MALSYLELSEIRVELEKSEILFVMLLNQDISAHFRPGSINPWVLLHSAGICVLNPAHCDRLCSASGTINLTTTGLANFMRICRVKCHAHILSSLVNSGISNATDVPTFSRRPSCGASTVINSALMPRLSACCTMRFVVVRSLLTYLQTSSVKLEKDEGDRRVQLEELHLTWLCSID